MKKTFLVAVLALVFLIPAGVEASSYGHDNSGRGSYNNNRNFQANYRSNSTFEREISRLLAEVQRLQAVLARLQNDGQTCYGGYCFDSRRGGNERADEIDVEYKNSAAYVSIEYTDGDDEDFIIAGADSDNEVIDVILDETDLSLQNILAVIDFSGDADNDDDDVEDIDVTIDRDDNDARARVRYEDGDTDTFTYNTDSKDEIIEELADDLDMDEDDVRDLTDFDYDDSGNNNDDFEDIDSIEIDIRNNKAYVRVEFEDGDISNYTYNTDDEDEIIEELADDLNVDEDDLEDFVDWE